MVPAVPSAQGGDHRVDGERAWTCVGLSDRLADGLLRAGLDAASLSRHGPAIESYWPRFADLKVAPRERWLGKTANVASHRV